MMKQIQNILYLAAFLSFTFVTTVISQPIPFDEGWDIQSNSYLHLTYQGEQALYLKDGIAVLEEESLKNGIIEFDIAFSGERGFVGAFWRMSDPGNYEEFYVRPHLSGMPDANQYTPVFNGLPGWQLYHGDGYSAPVSYRNNEWIPIKIVFWEERAQIYIDNMDEPLLHHVKLKQVPEAGKVGIKVGNRFTPAYFANFSYTELNSSPFDQMDVSAEEIPKTVISNWEISAPFEEAKLNEMRMLNETELSGLSWRTLKSEPTGILNLARKNGIEAGKNTVFARFNIESSSDQLKKLQFGYSDRIKVYLNGNPVYEGNNTYRTRDYRYLGTIGLFDKIYLQLKRGDNEVIFAVSESFGGWGIIGQIQNLEGISVN